MIHAPASFSSLSYGSHRWSLIQSLNFNAILVAQASSTSSCLQCCSLQVTLHALGHGPHAKIQFLSRALRVLLPVANMDPILPGSSSSHTTSSQHCQNSSCLQCPLSSGAACPLHASVWVLGASQMPPPSELPQSLSSRPHSLPSPSSSGMRVCIPRPHPNCIPHCIPPQPDMSFLGTCWSPPLHLLLTGDLEQGGGCSVGREDEGGDPISVTMGCHTGGEQL